MQETREAFLMSEWRSAADFADTLGASTSRYLASVPAVFVFLWALSGCTPTGEAEFAESHPFPTASVHFEQNATDGDVEVVFNIKAEDEGLSGLLILSPDGRRVVDFKAPEASTLGIRQFHFESPEPPDVDSLKAAYPEGVYAFFGTTLSGDNLAGRSSLSHQLPGTAEFIQPASENEEISVAEPKLSWTRVEDIAYYILEIEQDELNMNLTALLPASTTTFTLPDGLLLPGEEYELTIGTVSSEGNISFVEMEFTASK